MIELRKITANELKDWNKLVSEAKNSTIYHNIEWLRIIEKHTKTKLYPLIALKGEEIVCIFPIFYKKKGPVKMVFSPLPKTGVPYLGPLFLNYEGLKQDKKESLLNDFVFEFESFLKNRINANYVLIISPPGQLDTRSFKWNGYMVEPFYTYFIQTQGGIDNCWKQLKKNVRNDITRGQKLGITVNEGGKEEALIVYNSMKERFRAQEIDFPLQKDYFFDIFNEFYPENLRIFMVSHKRDIIGGLILILHKNLASHWQGASKSDLRGIATTDILQWETIKWSIKHKFKKYELLGANTQRLCQFKSKYNPNLETYFHLKKAKFLGKIAEKIYLRLLK
jgi:lipid II:glycine glycyltransferase (peptidoglycan interpeptide bridge formation enzyme)